METLWFVILATMLAVYTVLDGYDFGVGALHLIVARTEKERGIVLSAIGPLWDGNEVWLIATGGVLFFAFPLVYASSFSGLYLALFMVLWLLILRGISIELRHHVHSPLWTDFWDVVFSASSAVLALLFGVALGNVLRGMPLNSEGYFFLPLWTNLNPLSDEVGILDWYTIFTGLMAVVVLVMHGGHFLGFKTVGAIEERAMRISKLLYWLAALMTLIAVIITPIVQPLVVQRYWTHPIGFVLPVAAIASLVVVFCHAASIACTGGLQRLVSLHPAHAIVGCIRRLPEPAHCHHGPGQYADRVQCGSRAVRLSGRPGVVQRRCSALPGIHGLYVSHVLGPCVEPMEEGY